VTQATVLSQSIEAARLCGADDQQIAQELGVAPEDVTAWADGAPIPAEHVDKLEALAMGLVLHEIERTGWALVEQPHLAHKAPMRERLNDLNLAHWLAFGQSFLRYLRTWDAEQKELRDGRE
jgi:DNA-binding transcriptional regulator YdaS (Cro superfamily)